MKFSRLDSSVLINWWIGVDKWLFYLFALLPIIGYFVVFSTGSAVAERMGLNDYYFIKRQSLFLPMYFIAMIGISMVRLRMLRRYGVLAFFFFLFLMFFTLFWGHTIKGANRWLRLGVLSLQPSEFIKPTFIITTAWLFSLWRLYNRKFLGNYIACLFFAIVATILMFQPDFGMTILISMVWFVQFFLAGLSWLFVILVLGSFVLVGVIAYLLMPHVSNRIDLFFRDGGSVGYQVERAKDAFVNGSFWGTGLGEGEVKYLLPDSHTDFVFAVIGEELGVIAVFLVIIMFLFVILRVYYKAMNETNFFVLLSLAGLGSTFALQSWINLGSTMSMIPTKGMTLPFISYGGSSSLAVAVEAGMILALTRKRTRVDELDLL